MTARMNSSYFPRPLPKALLKVEEQLADIEWYAELLRDNTSYLWIIPVRILPRALRFRRISPLFSIATKIHNLTWKEYSWDVFKWKKFMEKVNNESIEV